MRNCFDCPMVSCGHSFGGGGNSHFYVRCEILRAVGIRSPESLIFEINLDEAKMLGIDDYQDRLHGETTSLYHALPGIFEGLHEYDDYLDPSRAILLREIIGCHPCIVTDEQIGDFIRCYREWVESQAERVQKEQEELNRLRDQLWSAGSLARGRNISISKKEKQNDYIRVFREI